GIGVNAYVIDTGVLGTHNDFGGRVRSGYTAINDGRGTVDCNGHGTHVAGTIGGTTQGVAKRANLVAVRVLDCGGSGSTSGVIAGVDWAAADHAAGTPAVANLSLGGSTSSALDAAVTALVNDGVSVSVAAGNDNTNACTQSPARAPAALTVAASDRSDARSSFSNYGTCVDLIAPGSGIVSDWYTSPTATATLSGTSMASPHVAGAAAVLLSQQRGLTPAQVASQLSGSATANVVTNPGTGTPNRLLYVDAPATTALAVTNPGNQTTVTGTAVSLTMRATDGSPPYTWSASGLPAGLTIGASTGVISGTPTTAATGTVTVTARDSAGLTASTSFSWTVTTPAPTTNPTPTPTPTPCTGRGQKLANPGFESGPSSWTGTPGAVNVRVGAKPARTGYWNAVLGGAGTATTSTVSQTVAIPAGCSTYTLTFWLRVDTADPSTTAQNDRLTVSLGTSTLATYSNLNRNTGYEQRTVDVAGQAGKTVALTFSAVENASLATSFAIDDTALTVG
ncbi:MAG: hypothetical protein QOK35_3407, partial [Pseudonocardiales bacterium]|nr:hypothetical protein [Pseudonocardiales bacterium]